MLLGTPEERRDHQGPADGPLRETLHQPGRRRPLPGGRGKGTSLFLVSLFFFFFLNNVLVLISVEYK